MGCDSDGFFFVFVLRLYSDLEKAVEDLSELLEMPIEADNTPTLRQKMTDKTVCLTYISLRFILYFLISFLTLTLVCRSGLRTETQRNHVGGHC